jgi:hypothetical protein
MFSALGCVLLTLKIRLFSNSSLTPKISRRTACTGRSTTPCPPKSSRVTPK